MITIRPEEAQDIPAIYAVNQQAFDGRKEEPGLVDALRLTQSFTPELSLVAVVDGTIAGHILFSKIEIDTKKGKLPAISLAPLAVSPDFQRQGIGTALVRHGLGECRRLGHQIVIVLGHEQYYPRFGFSAEKATDLECPYGDVGGAWMAIELAPGALDGVRGKVIYPPEFEAV